MEEKKNYTTSFGKPIDGDDQSLTTGGRFGHTVLEDVHLVQKLATFNRERIPERVVHARGSGAFGTFEVTNDLSKYTMADFLSCVGKKTEVFVRFSRVAGEKGASDSERDPRGFAVKFYTEQGNFDCVGNNTPVFFIRDPIKFPDFIHTQKKDPVTDTVNYDSFWDFLSLTPESNHQVTILFSDRGTPCGYRHMHGFGTNTFMWYNRKKEYVWVKFHFLTNQGIKNNTQEQAVALGGEDPDFSQRDLFDAIERKDFPSWTVCVQIMTPREAEEYRFDPFDTTKVWYHKDFPLIPLGKMVLNRNPENFFAEVEQSAFAPSSMVPGIGASPDKMLQGRMFGYEDTQRYRLGINFKQIPVNSAKATKVHNYQQDGDMRVFYTSGKPNYYPNSVLGTPAPDPALAPPAVKIDGSLARHPIPLEQIDYEQAGELYRRVLNEEERERLIANLAGHLGHAKEFIQYRQTAIFYKADCNYGERLAAALKLDVGVVRSLAAMTQEQRVKATSGRVDSCCIDRG